MVRRYGVLRALLVFTLSFMFATLLSTSADKFTAFAAQPVPVPITLNCDQTTSLIGTTILVVDLTDTTSGIPGGLSKSILVTHMPSPPISFVSFAPGYPANPANNYNGQTAISVPAGFQSANAEDDCRIDVLRRFPVLYADVAPRCR